MIPTDKGFEGAENHRRWLDHYGAEVVHPPKRQLQKPLVQAPEEVSGRGIRQIVESVYDKLFNTFGLWRDNESTSKKVCGLVGG